MQKNLNPRTLQELRVSVNMAVIALKAMSPADPRRVDALERVRQRKEALRVFTYKAHQTISPSGKLLRL